MKQQRLAIISTHPIQYNAPLFKLINEADVCFTIKVFYTWSQAKEEVSDKDFGLTVTWDIPLQQGYDFTFVKNTAASPGSHHFTGIKNPSLHAEIEEWKADAILVYGWAFSSHLKAIRYFHTKIPVLFRGDSTLLDQPAGFSIKKLPRLFFLTWLYSYVDYALYVGAANKEYFLRYGLKENQLLFAPHAVDNDRFADNDTAYNLQAAKWRLRLGISKTSVVFLFAAKLISKKNPELLIQAFISLNNSETTLIIAGNGGLENELKEKYKYNASILFINFQNQSVMPVLYRLGDVFVLPSRGPGETWGLAVNEAMACGRTVIASSKCGCSADLIAPGENGYIFESGNMASLANCMQLSLRHYRQQGITAGKKIKNWNYSKTARQLDTIFRNIIT